MRDLKGRFIKGNEGFWLGKKRLNLMQTGAVKTMFKKGIRNNPTGEFKKGHAPWNEGKLIPIYDKHWNWKGDEIGYYGVHFWINKRLGKANKCKNCGSTKNVDWSNISYEYKRDYSDWEQLCGSCHSFKDREYGWGLAKRRINK